MRQPRALTSFPLAAIVAAVAIASCQDESDTGPRVTGIQVAKPASQDLVAVTGTDPTGAPQDTTLDVEVFGSGFDNGSTVQLTLGGVPTEKVHTNSTRYRNSRTLIANITIAADAQVDFYDVEVTTASRKKGIGSEMFEVFTGGGNQIFVEFKRPASAELESFFRPAVTPDFASAPQPVDGTINEYSIQTKPTPFTLSLEPSAEFYDGKDPHTDPGCETEWLETILDAAAANGGSLDGSLELEVSWDQQLNVKTGITVRFIVAIAPWEYLMRFPTYGGVEDELVQVDGERTVLAARDKWYLIMRRKLGTKGGNWQDGQRCLMSSNRSNGLVDAEIWVWTQ